MRIIIDITQHVEDGLGHRPDRVPAPEKEPSKINGIFEPNLQTLERVKLLGAGKELEFERCSGGIDRQTNRRGYKFFSLLLRPSGRTSLWNKR